MSHRPHMSRLYMSHHVTNIDENNSKGKFLSDPTRSKSAQVKQQPPPCQSRSKQNCLLHITHDQSLAIQYSKYVILNIKLQHQPIGSMQVVLRAAPKTFDHVCSQFFVAIFRTQGERLTVNKLSERSLPPNRQQLNNRKNARNVRQNVSILSAKISQTCSPVD